jgi:hypothetical protein
VLLDTQWDDRAPNFCQLPNGTVLCSLFTYPGPSTTDLVRDPAKTTLTGIIRSFDNGRTWEQEPKRLPVPFVFDATDGPIIQLQDGSALICVYGRTWAADMVAFCRSTDSGDTWSYQPCPPTMRCRNFVAQLPTAAWCSSPPRRYCWSTMAGAWTKPVPRSACSNRDSALRDGTLLCLHGSYGAGGFRAMLSTDGGMTWLCPHEKWGFPVDPSVYGYGQAVELSDGSVWAGRRSSLSCLHLTGL